MKSYSIEEYKELAKRFNEKSILAKLIIIKSNPELFKLECDRNGSIMLRMKDDALNKQEIDLLFEFSSNLIETVDGVKALFEMAGIKLY